MSHSWNIFKLRLKFYLQSLIYSEINKISNNMISQGIRKTKKKLYSMLKEYVKQRHHIYI